MNDHSPERLALILSRADPPPIFYRYRPPGEFALSEIASPHLYATKVDDMNDPHEFRAPLSMGLRDLKGAYRQFLVNKGRDKNSAERESDSLTREQVELIFNGLDQRLQAFGLVCGTADPRSNRMWAYYGGSHRGICIGYDPQHAPFCYARKVGYEDPKGPLDIFDTLKQDPMVFSDHLSCRKGAEWEFEQEYRILGPFNGDRTRLLPISPESIVEIRLGAKIKPDFKAEVLHAVKSYPTKPRIIQMGCDHHSFSLTETDL